MQHHLVTDGHVPADVERKAGVGVEDGAFLDVARLADADRLVVAAGDGAEPEAGLVADDHFAHQGGLAGDEGGGGDLGSLASYAVLGHGRCSRVVFFTSSITA